MKVAHICISAPYIDGWGYQENLLPEYMSKYGVENHLIAPSDHFPSYLNKETIREILSKGPEYQFGSVRVHRIRTIRVSSSLLYTIRLRQTLEQLAPDAIFHHNFNCSTLVVASRYAKRHNIPLVVDNHADYINKTGNALWAFLYYRVLIRLSVLLCRRWIYRAYGVTHSRCDFMKEYYGVPEQKADFLPIGGDSVLASSIPDEASLRKKYGISPDSTVYVSGGKMGVDKGTDLLIRAFSAIGIPSSRLVLFGTFEDVGTEDLAKNTPGVMRFGWCDRVKTLELLKLADVACWPLHHTTLIEDSISVGTPVVVRKTGTSEHLIRGNGTWIRAADIDSVKDALLGVSGIDRNVLSSAVDAMRSKMDYYNIAKKVIDDINEYGR